MSNKKLIGIIVPCVIAIIVVIIITTHSPDNTREPEQVGVSAYNLAEQLLDPELTDLQREALWQNYEGKQVKWTNELWDMALGEGKLVVYFLNPLDWERSEIKTVFDESQRLSLLQCREGDLVTYTGILSSFGEDEISLTDCTFVSLAIVPLWWNKDINTQNKRILVGDEVLCFGPSTYTDATKYILPRNTAMNSQTGELLWEGKETESILMGIDSHYIYTCWLRLNSLSGGVLVRPNIEAVDKVSGQIAWNSSLSSIPLSLSGCQGILREILGREPTLADCIDFWILVFAIEEITNKAESSLTLLTYKPPLSELAFEYKGVIYKSACAVYGGVGTECGALQALDQQTGEVFWMMTFQEKGVNDFSIVDGILYVSTDEGIGAFELPNVANLQTPNSSEPGT